MSFPVMDFLWICEIRHKPKIKSVKVKGKTVVVRFDNGWRQFTLNRDIEDFLWDCVDLKIEVVSTEIKGGERISGGEVISTFKFKRIKGESDYEKLGIRLEDYR